MDDSLSETTNQRQDELKSQFEYQATKCGTCAAPCTANLNFQAHNSLWQFEPVSTYSVNKHSTMRQVFSTSLTKRYYYFKFNGRNKNWKLLKLNCKRNLTTFHVKSSNKPLNQYQDIVPQLCRFCVKRTSGLTIKLKLRMFQTSLILAGS